MLWRKVEREREVGEEIVRVVYKYDLSICEACVFADEAGRKNNYQLFQDQEICVLPNTCVNTGHIYSGGF